MTNGFTLYRPLSRVAYFYGLHALFGYDAGPCRASRTRWCSTPRRIGRADSSDRGRRPPPRGPPGPIACPARLPRGTGSGRRGIFLDCV